MPSPGPGESVSPRSANTPLAAHGLINEETFEYHLLNRTLVPFSDSGSDHGSSRSHPPYGSFASSEPSQNDAPVEDNQALNPTSARFPESGSDVWSSHSHSHLPDESFASSERSQSEASSEYSTTPRSSRGRTRRVGALHQDELSDSWAQQRYASSLSSMPSTSSIGTSSSGRPELPRRIEQTGSESQPGSGVLIPSTIQQIVYRLTPQSSESNRCRLENLVEFYSDTVSALETALQDSGQDAGRDVYLRSLVTMRDLKRISERMLQTHANPGDYSRKFQDLRDILRQYQRECILTPGINPSPSLTRPDLTSDLPALPTAGGYASDAVRSIDARQTITTQREPLRGRYTSDGQPRNAANLSQSFATSVSLLAPNRRRVPRTGGSIVDPASSSFPSGRSGPSRTQRDRTVRRGVTRDTDSFATAARAVTGPSDLSFAAMSPTGTSAQQGAGRQDWTEYPMSYATAPQRNAGPVHADTFATTPQANARSAPDSRQRSARTRGSSETAAARPIAPSIAANPPRRSAGATRIHTERGFYRSGVDGTEIRTEADVQRFLQSPLPDSFATARQLSGNVDRGALGRSPRSETLESIPSARIPTRNIESAPDAAAPQSVPGSERPGAERRNSRRRRQR